LVPKSTIWDALYENSGTLNVTVQSLHDDIHKFYINITVGPSQVVLPNAIFVGSNFDFKTTKEVGSAEEAIGFIQANWKKGIKEARRVVERIFETIVWNTSRPHRIA
jgi:hypothetical protein